MAKNFKATESEVVNHVTMDADKILEEFKQDHKAFASSGHNYLEDFDFTDPITPIE
jgi:hypothetical protein